MVLKCLYSNASDATTTNGKMNNQWIKSSSIYIMCDSQKWSGYTFDAAFKFELLVNVVANVVVAVSVFVDVLF